MSTPKPNPTIKSFLAGEHSPTEVAAFVYQQLITQGKPSGFLDPEQGQVCLYRAPDGCKCGIGHLIPDEDYKPSIEKKAVGRMLGDLYPRLLVAASLDERDFLGALQAAHDRASWASLTSPVGFIEALRTEMVRAMRKFNIKVAT